MCIPSPRVRTACAASWPRGRCGRGEDPGGLSEGRAPDVSGGPAGGAANLPAFRIPERIRRPGDPSAAAVLGWREASRGAGAEPECR